MGGKKQSLAVPLGRVSLSAGAVWWGGCGHWAVHEPPVAGGEQGPAEASDVPFQVGGGDWWHRHVRTLISPYLTHIPCQHLLSLGHLICPSKRPPAPSSSPAHRRLPRGLASSAVAQQVPQRGKSPVLSAAKPGSVSGGAEVVPKALEQQEGVQSTSLEIIKWL